MKCSLCQKQNSTFISAVGGGTTFYRKKPICCGLNIKKLICIKNNSGFVVSGLRL